MTWFKVDDGFHASHKLNSIPARHRFQAAGLWVIAGSWAGQQETDGHVPDYMIKAWGATRMTVESLVSAGLWRRERDGYSFCSWLEYNPSKEDADARRAASAERMRRSRERRRAEATGQEPPPEDVALQRSEVLRGNAATVLQRPDPTRPDPTRPITTGRGEKVREVERTGAPNQIPDDWLDKPWLARCDEHQGLDEAPPCFRCRDARRAAEHAAHAAGAARRAAAEAKHRAIGNCDLCDNSGQVLDDRGRPLAPAIACTHDEDSNADIVLAAYQRAEAEAEAEAERRERAAAAARAARARRAELAAAREEANRDPFSA